MDPKPRPATGRVAAAFLVSSLAAAAAGRWGVLGALGTVATLGAAVAAAWLGEKQPGLFSALPHPNELTLTPARPADRLRKDLAYTFASPGFYWRLAVLSFIYAMAGFISFGVSTAGTPRGAPLSPDSTTYLLSMFTYLACIPLAAIAGVGVYLGGNLSRPPE